MRSLMPRYFIAVFLMLSSSVFASEIRLFVATPAFIVSVAPVDEESKGAESSVLYQRPDGETSWTELGEAKRIEQEDGDIRFTREVQVEKDGLYEYTSRPVVAGRVLSPPEPDSPAQALVVVDTLQPIAELLTPEDGSEAGAAEEMHVSWSSEDENLAEYPVTLSYTTDGGKSWHTIARELPAIGDTKWTAPAGALPATIRLTATDRAGNMGRSLKNIRLAISDPVTPPELPPLAETPRPAEILTSREEQPEPREDALAGPNRSWLYYLMALNQMRQNKPADALQYYWLSVKEDPGFINAWADIGLAYIALGAYQSAREVVTRTLDMEPENIDLLHLMGETYHAEGMGLLTSAKNAEDRMRAKGLIDRAVEWYGRALEQAARDWRLADQAASFYRLGEICYYVNMDRDGARAYWKRILELHSPTPNSDLIAWAADKDKAKARERYQRYTHQRVALDTWQNWARGYIEQMDERERRGILDMMPAQKIVAVPTVQSLGYGNNGLNPGQDDGRSLFSLPGDLGSPSPVAIAQSQADRQTARMQQQRKIASEYNQPIDDYSFYGDRKSVDRRDVVQRAPGRSGRSKFSGGPDQPPPANPDPYAFPSRGRPTADWYGAGPYGNQPIGDW